MYAFNSTKTLLKLSNRSCQNNLFKDDKISLKNEFKHLIELELYILVQ